MMNTESKDFRIEYHRRVKKAFDKMSNNEFRLIDEKIQELRLSPRGRGRKKIGEDIYPMFRHPDFFFLLFFDADYADLR